MHGFPSFLLFSCPYLILLQYLLILIQPPPSCRTRTMTLMELKAFVFVFLMCIPKLGSSLLQFCHSTTVYSRCGYDTDTPCSRKYNHKGAYHVFRCHSTEKNFSGNSTDTSDLYSPVKGGCVKNKANHIRFLDHS